MTKAHVTDDGEQYVNDRNEANQILNAVDQINGKVSERAKQYFM